MTAGKFLHLLAPQFPICSMERVCPHTAARIMGVSTGKAPSAVEKPLAMLATLATLAGTRFAGEHTEPPGGAKTCPSTQSWNLHPGGHSAPLYGAQPPHPEAAPIGAVPEPSTPYPQPRAPLSPVAVTWCRSTCCYCGCAGASPRAVWAERRAGVRLQGEAPSRHPAGLRGLTLEVLARSCCSSRGDVTVGMRHSGDRFSLFCWRRSGRWLTAQQKVTRSPT